VKFFSRFLPKATSQIFQHLARFIDSAVFG